MGRNIEWKKAGAHPCPDYRGSCLCCQVCYIISQRGTLIIIGITLVCAWPVFLTEIPPDWTTAPQGLYSRIPEGTASSSTCLDSCLVRLMQMAYGWVQEPLRDLLRWKRNQRREGILATRQKMLLRRLRGLSNNSLLTVAEELKWGSKQQPRQYATLATQKAKSKALTVNRTKQVTPLT